MGVERMTLGAYTIAVDTGSGALCGLQLADSPEAAGHGGGLAPLAADLAWKAVAGTPRYLSHAVEGDALAVRVALGPLTLIDRLRASGGLLERRVEVENTSGEEVQLTGVRLALGGVSLGDPAACRFEAPANTTRARVPLPLAASQPRKTGILRPQYDSPPDPGFAPGARDRWNRPFADAPDVGPGLLVVHNPDLRWSLLTWYVSDVEAATPWVTGDGLHATLGFDLWLAGWLAPGGRLEGGTQYILLHDGPYESALAAYRDRFAQTGLLPAIYGPIDRAADWSAVYEVHPGQYGGFTAFTEVLPRLADLGIDTIYLLPVMSHRNKKGLPWDGNWEGIGSPYAMHDFTELEPSLGTEADFRELIHTAHDLGMRVLMDLVAQGSSLESHYVQEHPEWYARDERGNMVHSHGWNDTWSLDWANPDYQAYMLEWTTRYARDFKVDGYRVDAPHGKEPNWDRAIPYHASQTNLGVRTLLEALRRALLEVRPTTAMYCELFGPLWIRSHDISNDYHPWAMAYQLFHGTLSPAEFNEYLRDYWAVMPQAADGTPSPRICFTETHDTRSWPAYALRGSAISQALLGILVMAGFVPMLWAGQEKGQEEFIKGLLMARRRNAVLRRGRFLFNEVLIDDRNHYRRHDGLTPQDSVYTLIRHDERAVIFGVASLFPEQVTFRFGLPVDRLPLDPAGSYRLRDLVTYQFIGEYRQMTWTGAELADFTLTPTMFRPYLLRIEPVSEP